jgi:hypothetical protein
MYVEHLVGDMFNVVNQIEFGSLITVLSTPSSLTVLISPYVLTIHCER